MKSFRIVSCFILAVFALAMTGCAVFKRGANQNPAPPVSVAQGQQPVAAAVQTPPNQSGVPLITPLQAQQQSSQAFVRPARPIRVSFNTLVNIMDPKPGPDASPSKLVMTNSMTSALIFQIGDEVVSARSRDGKSWGVLVLPPGETYALTDPGRGEYMSIRALVLNDEGNRIGYIPKRVHWPIDGEIHYMEWDIKGAAAGQPDPMIPLPVYVPAAP